MGKAISKLVFCLALFTALLGSTGAHAGLQEGLDAYKNKNYKVALKELVPLAEDGNTVALYYIALMYETAEGLPQNYPQAMFLYRKAADAGHVLAQCNLGYMYETEAGPERSYKDAAFWYQKAAAQGNAAAQFNLGLMNFVGRGSEVPRNFREAAAWYQKAAEQRNAPAQNSLGKMYENGQGVPVSLTRAYMWYSLSSASGNEAAKLNKHEVETKMDPDMIEQAQAMVREWSSSHK